MSSKIDNDFKKSIGEIYISSNKVTIISKIKKDRIYVTMEKLYNYVKEKVNFNFYMIRK